MFIYYARRYNSATIGSRIAEVACDHCGTQYFYELARVGTGEADAPYAIGSGKASRKAGEKAWSDARRRLTDDAELTPCPKCGWVNDDLIAAHRRGRYRRWTKNVSVAVMLLCVATTFFAWSRATGPWADQRAATRVLAVGLPAWLAVGGAALGLRAWLRSRIRPNRDYPLPPTLPMGTPPPLVFDPETQQLRPAELSRKPDETVDPWVDFQVGRNALPDVCCECLGPPSPEAAYQKPILQSLQFDAPRCEACASVAKRRTARIVLTTLGVATLIGLPVPKLWDYDAPGTVAFALVWLSVAALVGLVIAGGLVRPLRIRTYDASRGVYRLRFRNDDYRRLIAD